LINSIILSNEKGPISNKVNPESLSSAVAVSAKMLQSPEKYTFFLPNSFLSFLPISSIAQYPATYPFVYPSAFN